MKIKWCSDIFSKYKRCNQCIMVDEYKSKQYCYGILYPFYKIKELARAFFYCCKAIIYVIKEFIKGKYKDDLPF